MTHPYKLQRPIVTATSAAEDFPELFAFSQSEWDVFAAINSATRFANRGEAEPAHTGYVTVFEDHFLSNTVVDDWSGAKGSIWYAPTWLASIGVQATAQRPADTPSSYVHDGSSALALRLLYSGGWKTGAFSSVNKTGQGRWWTKGIFEIRCKFPNLPPSGRPGFFPAFWAYGREHLIWRSRNRNETDFWEYDGLNGAWINITQHVHQPSLEWPHPDIRTSSDISDKFAGYEVSTATDPDFAGTIDIYDGVYHIWKFKIEDALTYVYLDGEEIVRVATPREFLVPKYILVDLAYGTPTWGAAADTGETYDMTIDYIRVSQLETDLEVVPTGFSARPTIAGTTTSGSTLTMTPHTVGDQIDYLWYRDGFPIVTALASTYVLVAADVGHKIRGTAQNLSLVNQPLGTTAETATIT